MGIYRGEIEQMRAYTGYCGYCGFIVFGGSKLSAEGLMLDHIDHCHPDKGNYGLVAISREEWYDYVTNRENPKWWHDLRNSVHSLPIDQEYSPEELVYIA